MIFFGSTRKSSGAAAVTQCQASKQTLAGFCTICVLPSQLLPSQRRLLQDILPLGVPQSTAAFAPEVCLADKGCVNNCVRKGTQLQQPLSV